MYEILEKLCRVRGVSGCEENVAELFSSLLPDFPKQRDVLGNLTCTAGKKATPAVLIDAHMDEIGFIVTGYDSGFLVVAAVGSIDPRLLPATTLTVHAPEPLCGVFACLPPHILSAEQRDKTVELRQLRVDIGLSDAESRQRVPLGTRLSYRSAPVRMGKHRICAPALDNRVGMAVIVRTMQLLEGFSPEYGLYLCGSVQEEVGCRGVQVAASALCPDIALVLDATYGETPGLKNAFKLGGGPCIGLGPNCDRALSDKLIAICNSENIPYQPEVMEGNTHTNAWSVQTRGLGTRCAIISVPVRYMHSPNELCDMRDAENAARLIAAFLRGLSI